MFFNIFNKGVHACSVSGKDKTNCSYALSYSKLLLFAKVPMATPNMEADLIEEAWTHACKVNSYKKTLSDGMRQVVSFLLLSSINTNFCRYRVVLATYVELSRIKYKQVALQMSLGSFSHHQRTQRRYNLV